MVHRYESRLATERGELHLLSFYLEFLCGSELEQTLSSNKLFSIEERWWSKYPQRTQSEGVSKPCESTLPWLISTQPILFYFIILRVKKVYLSNKQLLHIVITAWTRSHRNTCVTIIKEFLDLDKIWYFLNYLEYILNIF